MRGSEWEEECGVFSVYFGHSEGWTPRNEALLEAKLKQAKATIIYSVARI